MRATTTALGFLALLYPIVSGFHISGKEKEGQLYKVYFDESGKEVHELVTPEISKADTKHAKEAGILKVAPSVVSARDVRRQLEARDDQRLYCGCGLIMDRSDCDAAVANMKQQIRNHGGTIAVPIGQAYYAVRGSVVSFVCTRRGNTAITPITVDGFTGLLGQITYYCGQYVPGTYKHGTPIDTAAEDVGYMFSGGDFCARAEASNRDRCW